MNCLEHLWNGDPAHGTVRSVSLEYLEAELRLACSSHRAAANAGPTTLKVEGFLVDAVGIKKQGGFVVAKGDEEHLRSFVPAFDPTKGHVAQAGTRRRVRHNEHGKTEPPRSLRRLDL